MATFGRQTLTSTGNNIQVTADGKPEWKTGGVTIDWSTVAAVAGSDYQIPIELTTVVVGQKFLRYGQILTKITASGKFGPYDPAAADGRQLLVRGECFILNETVLQNGLVPALGAGATDHPAVFEGGAVYKDRLLQSGTATHTLALGPTLAETLAAFPRLRLVEN